MITRHQSRIDNGQKKVSQQDNDILIEEPDFFKEVDFQRKLIVWLKIKMGKSERKIAELIDKPMVAYRIKKASSIGIS